ncbi:hypothetical protein JCM11251_004155 [Rhodosporidiobolus azoricus]
MFDFRSFYLLSACSFSLFRLLAPPTTNKSSSEVGDFPRRSVGAADVGDKKLRGTAQRAEECSRAERVVTCRIWRRNMPSAADYKKEGNKAFAAKKWLKAAKLYSTLDDANAAVRDRPDWSKAYARVGECFARLQDFGRAEIAYAQAVKHAEDDAARTRYQASLKTTQDTHEKARRLDPSPHNEKLKIVASMEETWIARVQHQVASGYVPDPRGALVMSWMAYNTCQEGIKLLDEVLIAKDPRSGHIHGRYQSDILTHLSECILLDENAFVFEQKGKNPDWSVGAKLLDLVPFEFNASNLNQYYSPSPLPADKIIDDLDRRRVSEGDSTIRRVFSSILIRGHILSAFLTLATGDLPAAITSCNFALALLDAGAAKWADRDYSEKGMCFKPTFRRLMRAYLLRNLLRGHRDARLTSAKRNFKLEDIEKLAKEIIAENNPSNWPAFDGSPDRVAYNLMPQWEAYSALAYFHNVRARQAIPSPPPIEKAIFFDLDEAKKAAVAYRQTLAIMPDDWRGKADMMWYGAEAELRAGGLTVSRFLDLVDEASRVEAATAPISTGTFASVLKALSTVLAPGRPAGWDPHDVLSLEEWAEKPGEVIIIDVRR